MTEIKSNKEDLQTYWYTLTNYKFLLVLKFPHNKWSKCGIFSEKSFDLDTAL